MPGANSSGIVIGKSSLQQSPSQMNCLKISFFVLLACSLVSVHAQQVPDLAFHYKNIPPAYAKAKGPLIILDEAHLNFHTLDGRYGPFGNVLLEDGYVVRAGKEKFTSAYLNRIKILAIANARGDTGEWKLPTRAAFTTQEVQAVEKWVEGGGSLLLIADHMPCAGAAANLAQAFGFNFINGFAFRKDGSREIFSRKLKNLSANPVSNGRSAGERVDSIEMFTGSAFIPPPSAIVITSIDSAYVIELPSVAGEFSDTSAKISGMHCVNGAMLQYGRGRVVIFGEAAMFTAQLQGPDKNPMGMNQPSARQNPQLLLNIIHWLDGKL
jgi:hypothetical protein